MYQEEETLSGILLTEPNVSYTNNGKMLCKIRLETEDEELRLVAWEELAEELSSLFRKNNLVTVKGYRKFNNYLQKEEFILKFIKGGI